MSSNRVAIIGSGVSGLGAAWLLTEHSSYEVTIYEQGDYIGGHAHTVDYAVPERYRTHDSPATIAVDTGFIVFNPITYPNLIRFFKHKGVEWVNTEMNFSVSRDGGAFEWAGRNPITVFAQPRNLLSIDMWRTLYDIIRFNFRAIDLLELDEGHTERKMTLGEFLDRHGYSTAFRDNYLLPITAAIWSTPIDKCSLDFPALTLIQFMHNHCLLQISNRVKWRTVVNGSRSYIEKIVSHVRDIRLSTRVTSVTRRPKDSSNLESGAVITIYDNKGGVEHFDHVLFATHADQALQILGHEATEDEKRVLGAIQFSKNRAVLHNDLSLMPTRRLAFAAWNYLTKSTEKSRNIDQVSLTYSMNILQHIDEAKYGPVLVTLNPLQEPSPSSLFGEWDYEHPTYTPALIAAQQELPSIQNRPNLATTFAGAWTKYGFHEDGFTSGMRIAIEHLHVKPPFGLTDATYARGRRPQLTRVQKVQRTLWIGFEWFVFGIGCLITWTIVAGLLVKAKVAQTINWCYQKGCEEKPKTS